MKKIILAIAMILGTMTFAQDYYDTYPQNYDGYEYYNDSYNYPDDYYYNYPADYYPDQYYQGYYNDYQRAVFSVNWDAFFGQYGLTPWQMDQIIALNNRFANFAAWNAYYRWNPNRWYYDRFYALQNILGPRVFVVYQNVFYHGRSPIVFYKARFNNFYVPRYPVRPMYQGVNIASYRIDRNNFRADFRNPSRGNVAPSTPRDYNSGFRNTGPRSGSNGNFGNVRPNDNIDVRSNSNGGGFRNNSGGSVRPMPSPGASQDGFRQNQGGFRQNQAPERRMDNQRGSSNQSQGSFRSSGNRFAAN